MLQHPGRSQPILGEILWLDAETTEGITTLENPYGMSLGKGKAVRTASGDRTHVAGSSGETLCGSAIDKGRPSSAKIITCYRCIKLLNMDGLNTRERKLKYGKRSKHYMVPGGREGKYVSGVDIGSSLSDAEFEAMMGDENYPTPVSRDD